MCISYFDADNERASYKHNFRRSNGESEGRFVAICGGVWSETVDMQVVDVIVGPNHIGDTRLSPYIWTTLQFLLQIHVLVNL